LEYVGIFASDILRFVFLDCVISRQYITRTFVSLLNTLAVSANRVADFGYSPISKRLGMLMIAKIFGIEKPILY